jgi:hypothetical protein
MCLNHTDETWAKTNMMRTHGCCARSHLGHAILLPASSEADKPVEYSGHGSVGAVLRAIAHATARVSCSRASLLRLRDHLLHFGRPSAHAAFSSSHGPSYAARCSADKNHRGRPSLTRKIVCM